MQKISSSFLLLFLFTLGVKAQVGINILIPDSSAVLQLVSPTNNKGLGLTQLNTPQMNSVWQPLDGLTIFNTTDSVIEYWNGECWLKAYQAHCNECEFDASLSHNTDTIDRTYVDSAFTTLTVNQLSSNQNIEISYMGIPPAGVQVYVQGNTTITDSGSVNIVVKTNIWSQGGLVPLVLVAVCGDQYHLLTYNVYIKPCIEVDIPMDILNYNLQGMNSSVLPAGVRECVIVDVYPNVEVTSALPTDVSYTSGNLHPLSIVGIKNNGYIFGRGGDGGSLGGVITGGTAGQDGGDAMHLTTRTIINNYGGIYGGGGGGGSIGLAYPISINIPLIGSYNFQIGIGIGGGGGSASGQGGSVPSGSIAVGGFYAGLDATPGHNSIPGSGSGLAVPISITYSGIGVQLTPVGGGGDGGPFGQPGTSGSLSVCIALVVPIVGTINIACPTVANPGPPGQPGLAIKRNNNSLTGVADGTYNNNQVKGQVAP